MLPSHNRRRKRSYRSSPSTANDCKTSGNVKEKLKMNPFPEATGHSLHTPHPLRELNSDQHGKFPKLKMELSFADLEEGTSALSTPSSLNMSRLKNLQETSAGLNQFSFFESNVDDSSERHFKRKAGTVETGANLKPTDILALKKKQLGPAGCGADDGDGRSTGLKGILKTPKSGCNVTMDETGVNADTPTGMQRDLEMGVSQEEGVSQPSAQVRGMWDNVVSWMKIAVDFVSKDTTAEAEPTNQSTSRGKMSTRSWMETRPHKRKLPKRVLVDPDFSDSPTSKQPRASAKSDVEGHGKGSPLYKVRGRRRKSLVGFKGHAPVESCSTDDLKSAADIKSATASPHLPSSPISSLVSECSPPSVLSTKLSDKLAIVSPAMIAKAAKNVSAPLVKWKPSHLEASSSFNHGLNSILDESLHPVPRKIRRQSLRTFYGNSFSSPNLTEVPATSITVRRSPRIHASSAIPVPPPLPPTIPAAPPPPPPPPYCSSSSAIITSTPSLFCSPALQSTGGMDPSRDLLSQMQSRLRSRIKKKGGGKEVEKSGEVVSAIDGKCLDIKERQWAEIQARRRKIPLKDFLTQTIEKKKELERVLCKLDQCLPATFKGISEVVEVLQEGAQWFSGGNRDMRESLPLYKKLEKKLETLTEYVHVCSEMSEVALLEPASIAVHQHCVLYTALHQVKEEFDAKHRHWGSIVSSNAESWASVTLPVCRKLLRKSSDYMCELVNHYINRCLEEAKQLNGILLSIKCMRTTKLKDALKDCLSFLSESNIYFCHDRTLQCPAECQFCSSTPENPAETCIPTDSSGSSTSGSAGSVRYDQSLLVSLSVSVLTTYVEVALRQYEGYVSHLSRLGVCEHFEGILKLMSITKSILCTVFSTRANSVRNSGGYLQLIPDPERLQQVLYESCEMLVQHIMDKASPIETGAVSPSSEERLSKEVVLWMMFGCKYIHQSLEFLGTEHAQKMGLVELLQKLQHMEGLL